MTAADAIARHHRAAPTAIRARPAGFVADLAAIAGRALRGIPREPRGRAARRSFIAAVLLRRERRRTLQNLTRGRQRRASTTRRSSCRRRSCSASPASRGRRRSCSTSRTATSTGCCSRRSGGWRSCSGSWSPTSRSSSALTRARSSSLGLRASACASRPGLLGVLGVHRARRRCGASRSPASRYAIALKTGNPAAVNSSFLLFFPFAVPHLVVRAPRRSSPGWLDTVAGYNPVTYLLEGLRSLVIDGLGVGRRSARRCSPSPSSAPSACRSASPPSAAACSSG